VCKQSASRRWQALLPLLAAFFKANEGFSELFYAVSLLYQPCLEKSLHHILYFISIYQIRNFQVVFANPKGDLLL